MTYIEDLIEELRHDRFHTFTNNCLRKSFMLQRACKAEGIQSAVVVTLSMIELRRFGLHGWFPFTHAWVYLDHERVEVARPLEEVNPWGSYDIDLTPILGVWIW